jgi:hypothetical protein
MQSATIIDTDANLRKHLNTVALRSNTAGANTVSGAVVDVTLTNPMALYQSISFAIPGKKVILPPMNAPNSVPIGVPFVIVNDPSSTAAFDLYYSDGFTIAQAGMTPGDAVSFTMTSNATANGTFLNGGPQVANIFGQAGVGSLRHAAASTVSSTRMAMLAREVIAHDVLGTTVRYTLTGAINCDISAAGPAVNGRDQAGTFAASSTVHLYYIFGVGHASGAIASLVSPDVMNVGVMPALPSGYTLVAYSHSVVLDGSGNLPDISMVGDRILYNTRQVALNAGAATVDTAVSVSALVPVIAYDFNLMIESWGVTADGTGAAISVLHLGAASGVDTQQLVTDFAVGPTTATRIPAGEITFPNNGQQFFYHHQVLNGSAPAMTATLRSYRVPNAS